jgi:hypothetical protein
MNNVIIKRWVHDRIENGILIERAHYEEKPAVLLHWGIAYEELNNGTGMFTVAFVRLEDGSVYSVHPSEIRFIIDDKKSKLEAAAPELLEALKELTDWVTALTDWSGGTCLDPKIEKCRKAIWKATK